MKKKKTFVFFNKKKKKIQTLYSATHLLTSLFPIADFEMFARTPVQTNHQF